MFHVSLYSNTNNHSSCILGQNIFSSEKSSFIRRSCNFPVRKKDNAILKIQSAFYWRIPFILCVIAFFKIIGRAISLQKVHLWMDCSKRILWSWTQSKAIKIRAATVQSSVWTLQQILSDRVPFFTRNRIYLSPFINFWIFFIKPNRLSFLKQPILKYAM